MALKDKLILALDMQDPGKALNTVDTFSEWVNVYKVGLELFTAAGPDIVRKIHDKGKKVFLDLKLHDIPNTVMKAAEGAARLGVFMFNVHTSGGSSMMKKCCDHVHDICQKEGLQRPKIIGVTVLTSIDQAEFKQEMSVTHSIRTHVKHLAVLSQNSGLDGVVASGHEASMIRSHCGNGFIIVTPGIRPSWSPPDDQKRTMTPKDALSHGADYIVMGRGILGQDEPIKAVELISLEIIAA